jgi:tetratricopeptide (TPR) repeat protein
MHRKLSALPDERADAEERHRRYFGELFGNALPSFWGPGARDAMKAMADSLPDVRAAWYSAASVADTVTIARLIDPVCLYYEVKGPAPDARAVLMEAAALLRASPDSGTEAVAQVLDRIDARVTWFKWETGEVAGRPAHMQELLDRALDRNQLREAAYCAARLCRMSQATQQFDHAFTRARQALDLYTRVNDVPGVAAALNDIGSCAFQRNDHVAAEEHWKRAMSLWRDLGHERGVAVCAANLGAIAATSSRFEEARDLLSRAVRFCRGAGDEPFLAVVLSNYARMLIYSGAPAAALDVLDECLEIAQRLGVESLRVRVHLNFAKALITVGKPDSAVGHLRSCADSPALFHQPNLASALLCAALIQVARGEYERAAEAVGRALATVEVVPVENEAEFDELNATLTLHLKPGRLKKSLERGASRDLAHILAQLGY